MQVPFEPPLPWLATRAKEELPGRRSQFVAFLGDVCAHPSANYRLTETGLGISFDGHSNALFTAAIGHGRCAWLTKFTLETPKSHL